MSHTESEVATILVENHRKFLGFLEKRVGARDVAEDILQDALVRGLQRADQLRDSDSVIAWFYRALRNAVVDHWRKTGTEKTLFSADEEDLDRPADPELMRTVCECASELLETLKPEYAAALRRVEMDGISVKDFAQETGVTPNNASVRLFRARDALRRQVERCCGTCADHGCVDCDCRRDG